MRVLIVTRIFPNASDPVYAPYHRQQFRALAERCEVEVLAAIPFWKRGVPRTETIDGMPVVHPRFVYVPKITMANGALYAASLARAVLARRGRYDVLLGAFAFPDGVAAVALGRVLGTPVVVKVIGSDINVLSGQPM